jgi:nuclear protein localization family protein 4
VENEKDTKAKALEPLGKIIGATPNTLAPPPAAAAASSSSTAASSSSAKPPAATTSETGTGGKVEAKFETFDAFLRNRRYDITTLPGSQKYVSGLVKQGGMIKIPPSVSTKQQPYRHVDTLSVMNVPEMEYFIGYWQNHLLENAMQRVGWMYGYYLEDKNYDEGCRAVMEGIYEPPQEMMGEMAVPKEGADDPGRTRADRIAEALGLERIGWIFTSLLLDDDQLLTPIEVQKIARLQDENSTDAHFTKYTLSKFVTCAVRPDVSQGGLPAINPFMVSDQCVAMVRDGVLADASGVGTDRKHLVIREPTKNELIPSFITEGKPSKKLLTDFVIVRVNDTTPKKLRSMFMHADFPRENRPTHPQRRDDLKRYFKKREKNEPSWSKYADFHLICYIAQEIDLDTALAICKSVTDRTEIDEGIQIIMNELIQ